MVKKKQEPNLWLSQSLIESSAWRMRSINCRRLIDFLCIENVKSAGTKNGKLYAPYKQLVSYGIPRRKIFPAIREAEGLGLIRVDYGIRIGRVSEPNQFTLTFHHTLEQGKKVSPSHEWKQMNDHERLRQTLQQIRQKIPARSGIISVPQKGKYRFH